MLQAQHKAAQSTILALKSQVMTLESVVKSQSVTSRFPTIFPGFPGIPGVPRRYTKQLEKSVEGHWSTVREEWASEHERLASARKEWETKVKCVETNLGTTAVKFNAGLASLAVLQPRR
jgi:hypothetical protein